MRAETIGHTIKSTIDKAGHDIKLERMVVEPKFRDQKFKKMKRALRKDVPSIQK